MPIVDSKVYKARVGPDGWKRVTEHHTDHAGEIHTWRGHYPPEYVPEDGLVANGAKILALLERAELHDSIEQIEDGEDPATIPIKHHTRQQLLIFVFKRLINAAKRDPERTLRFLSHFAGYTDAQIAGALGIQAAKVAALRAKVIAFKAARDDVEGLDLPTYPEVEDR